MKVTKEHDKKMFELTIANVHVAIPYLWPSRIRGFPASVAIPFSVFSVIFLMLLLCTPGHNQRALEEAYKGPAPEFQRQK